MTDDLNGEYVPCGFGVAACVDQMAYRQIEEQVKSRGLDVLFRYSFTQPTR